VRFNYLFFYLNIIYIKVFFIFTIVLAGFCACIETDFKKIVAISTLRQLGLMLFTLSTSTWVLTYIHMIIHAFFKRLLFINTGSLIHSLIGGQDSRLFGGNSFSFRCFICFFVSCACLIGFPFFIGFYSKDLIILRRSLSLGRLFYVLFLIGCFLTVFYRFRLLKEAFLGMTISLTQRIIRDDKIFMFSISFLFFKSWLIGRVFFPTVFFDRAINFSGFDLL
jgi:NADH-quinone oxidoreductase subunit L